MLFPVWLQEFTPHPSMPQDGRWKLRLVCMGAQKQIVTLQTHPYQSNIFFIPSTVIGEHLLSPNFRIFMTRKCPISPSSPGPGSSSTDRKLSWAGTQITQPGALSSLWNLSLQHNWINPLETLALSSRTHTALNTTAHSAISSRSFQLFSTVLAQTNSELFFWE